MITPTDIFVGRERELEALRGALDQALAGHGRIIMLAGEPGIGKTRTAQELAGHAASLGAMVLWGRCHEESGAPPYWPWVQIIRVALRSSDADALLTALGAGASDMADILPEIRDRLPHLEPSARLEDPAEARWRMFESIRRLIAGLCSRRPLLLVLDDLHWADAPSLRLLEFLAPELADSRLLLIGTYRANELSRQHPLSDTLGALTRVPQVTRMHLTGISVEEAQAVIAAAAGASPPIWLAASLQSQTEGNPLFLREIVRFLQQQGVLGADRSVPLAALPATIRIPEGVREVIGRRLNLLSATCNDVLAVAAVIGRTFGHDLLARAAAPHSENVLLEAMDEALAARVIEELPDGSYQFTHNLVRMTLYDELRTARRRQLHRSVGAAIKVLHRGDSDTVLPELARHFLAAGDIDQAVEYATQAGQRAETLLAFEDAVQFFQAALDAMEQRTQVDDAGRCSLLLRLGEAQRKSSNFPLALATLREAAENARELGLADILAHAALSYERAAWRIQRPPEVSPDRLLADALRLVPEADIALRIELMGGLARALLHGGAEAEARAQLAQAIAMARRLRDPGLLATTLNYLFDFPWQPKDTEEILARATETLEAAQLADNVELVALAQTRRLVCSFELGDVTTVADELDHLARIDARIRQPIYSTVLLGLRATVALMRGELDTTERLVSQALTHAGRAGSSQMDYLSVLVFCLRREQGRLKELQAALSLFMRQTGGVAWRPGLVILYLELDRLAEARSEFEQLAAQDFADIPHDGRWTTCLIYLAEVTAAFGDAARAGLLYQMLLPYAERVVLLGGGVACVGSGGRHLGLLCATMRRWPQAQRHFEDALALNARIGAWLPLAHTRHDYAVMLLARQEPGDRERATALLRQSLESARELGMRALEQRVTALLEHLTSAKGATSDDLTAREIEVLELIAIGRSNADIATVLAISLNTVASHVRNILGKTGCANRTEAASYAMRHGLAHPG